MMQSHALVTRHLRWVPHSLAAIRKAGRVTLSNESLGQFRPVEYHAWQFIITLDESWFYFSPFHEHIWLRP
jgi:hypothetical protein